MKIGDPKSETTYIEFNSDADKDTTIVVTPVCAERPYPSVEPNSTGGNKPKNTPVIINFDQVIKNSEKDLDEIDIQITGESILSHYKTPVYTNENRSILFEADNDNLLDFTSGTKTVSVIIPENFYYETADGTAVKMNSEVTSTFTIDYTTQEWAVISLDVEDSASGKLNKSGSNTFYMGEEFTLIFTMEDGYQFGGWNVSLSEDVEGTIETKTDDDGTTRIYLNETAILEEVDNDEDFDEEYYASLNKYQKIYRVLSGARDVKISPVCTGRPYPTVDPSSASGAKPKNSPVTITFNYGLSNPETDLSKIDIKIGDESILSHYKTPVYKDDNKTVFFDADNENLLDFTSGTKTVTVSIPAVFYYETADGTKICMKDAVTSSFTIDYTTKDSAVISIGVDDANSGKLNTTGNNTYYMGEKFTLIFTMAEGYQFGSWSVGLNEGANGKLESKTDKAGTTRVYLNGTAVLEEVSNGDDFDEEYYASLNKYQKIYKVLAGARDIKISPVCYERPEVESVSPANSEAVAKNSPIIITFSEKMDISDDDLNDITITMDGLDAKKYFKTPVKSDNSTTGKTQITFSADRSNLIDASAGNKNITVTIPQSFYHEESDGTEVTLLSDYSYTYAVNNNTADKIELYFPSVSNGIIDSISTKTLYLDQSYTVSCTASEGYEIKDWTVKCEENDVSEEIISQEKSDDRKSITLTVLSGLTGTVTVKPVIEAKKYVQITVSADYGTTIPAGNAGKYYSGDTVELDYREDSDYQFTGWTIKKLSGSDYVELTDEEKLYFKFNDTQDAAGSENYTTTLSIDTLDKDYSIKIYASAEKRPKVVSAIPGYDSEGVYRDRKLMVMFDEQVSEETIYYSETERTDIESKNEGKTVNWLETKNNSGKYYGYQLDDDKNSIVYKCISIVNLQKKDINLLRYYGVPEFDLNNTSVLRLGAKSDQTDEMPPAATDILVKLTTSTGKIYTNETTGKEYTVCLSGEYVWSYYTNSKYDNTPPTFSTDFKISIANQSETAATTVSLLDTDIFDSARFSDDKFKENSTIITNYNLKNKALWIYGTVIDGGSGPKSLSAKVYRVSSSQYPCDENKTTDPVCTYDATLEIIGSNAKVATDKLNGTYDESGECFKLDELSEEGLYKVVFTATDKNDLTNQYKPFYFIYDTTPPAALTDFVESRTQSGKATVSWKATTESDIANIEIIPTNVDDNSNNGTTANLSSSNSSHDFEVIDSNHYKYTALVYDYCGNISERAVTEIDYTAPAALTDFVESRTQSGKATVSWKATTESDIACIKIISTNKTSNNANETTASVSRNVNSNVFNVTDYNKYQYTATVYDYSGNASTSVTTAVDNTAPSAITNLKESRTQSGKASVTWTKVTESGVGKIEIVPYNVDDGTYETTVTPGLSDTSSTISVTDFKHYQYTAKVYDYSGNVAATQSVIDYDPPSSKSSVSYKSTVGMRKINVNYTKPSGDSTYSGKTTYATTGSETTISDISSTSQTFYFGDDNTRTHTVKIRDYDYSGNATETTVTLTAVPAIGMIYYLEDDGTSDWSSEYISTETPAGIVFRCNESNSYGNARIVDLHLDSTARFVVNTYDGWGGGPYGWKDPYQGDGRSMYDAVMNWPNVSSLLNASEVYYYLANTKNQESKWKDNGIVWYLPGVNEYVRTKDNALANPTILSTINAGYNKLRSYDSSVVNLYNIREIVCSTLDDGNNMPTVRFPAHESYESEPWYTFNKKRFDEFKTQSLYMAHVNLN